MKQPTSSQHVSSNKRRVKPSNYHDYDVSRDNQMRCFQTLSNVNKKVLLRERSPRCVSVRFRLGDMVTDILLCYEKYVVS